MSQREFRVIKIQENHMKTAQFVGREAEMARLKGLLSTRSANLIVVRGRRRIGKSRLLAEFGKEIKSYFFLEIHRRPR